MNITDNPNYKKDYWKKWYQKNKTRHINNAKKWATKNPIRVKEWKSKNFLKLRQKREDALRLLNPNYIPERQRTDWVYLRKICARCHLPEKDLMKHSIKGKRQYYICRTCNTKRHKKYRLTQSGKIKSRFFAQQSEKNHPEKTKARQIVHRNLLSGKLIKPLVCNRCFKSLKIEAHHDDYTKPLEVIWVCRSCHADIHKLAKKI